LLCAQHSVKHHQQQQHRKPLAQCAAADAMQQQQKALDRTIAVNVLACDWEERRRPSVASTVFESQQLQCTHTTCLAGIAAAQLSKDTHTDEARAVADTHVTGHPHVCSSSIAIDKKHKGTSSG
jgi:hypothetical protein